MFTPVAIDLPTSRFPWATLGLVALMGIGTAWVYESPEAVWPYVLTPWDVQPWQFLTSLFLHLDVLHFVFNAIYLWVFGRYVEDRLGPGRFAILFLLLGSAASGVYLARGEGLPALGASGAIAGLMALTLFQAPRAAMVVAWGSAAKPPVWVIVGFWLAVEIFKLGGLPDGIAHSAHVGGALAGCLAAWCLRSQRLANTGWHFPREPEGGLRHSAAYEKLTGEESMWKAIYERKRMEREMRGE